MINLWLPVIITLAFVLAFLALTFLEATLVLGSVMGILFLVSLVLGLIFNLGLSLAFGYVITFPRVIGLGIILTVIGLVTGGVHVSTGDKKVEVGT